jgi:aryl-alcohol dehydrogenase-like predicted oxidoreductase
MAMARRLGKSELKVSEIGLGCWAIGGPSFDDNGEPTGWSGNNDADSLTGLYKAYELGVNHWDTADVYGKGHSERLIGRVFREGVKREEIVLASKVGWHKGTADHSFEPLHIRNQLEQSLKNLNTDYLDIYYLHNPFFGERDHYLKPAAETMHQLKEEGKIRVIGQSAYSFKQFLRVCHTTQPQVLQLPYNALSSPFDTSKVDIFSWAAENDLGVVMFGAYAKGILLGKYDENHLPQLESGDVRVRTGEFKADFLKHLKQALNRLRDRFGGDLEDLARVANQYALSKSESAVVIPGFKNERQVSVNTATMNKPLTTDEIKFVESVFESFKK